jgi:hypothetical protein
VEEAALNSQRPTKLKLEAINGGYCAFITLPPHKINMWKLSTEEGAHNSYLFSTKQTKLKAFKGIHPITLNKNWRFSRKEADRKSWRPITGKKFEVFNRRG